MYNLIMARNKNIQNKNSTEAEFYKIYSEKIVPILNDFEHKRKVDLMIYFATMAVLVLIMIGICHLPWITFKCIAFFVFIIAIIIAHMSICDSFKDNLKKACLPKLLKAFGDIHWKKTKISDSELASSELFSVFNEREDDDYFNGKYKGVEFKILETKLENIRRTSKGNIVWPVFMGVIISVTSNKTIGSKTIITTKGDLNRKNQDPLTIIAIIILASALILPLISGLAIMGMIGSRLGDYGKDIITTKFIISMLGEFFNPISLIPTILICFVLFVAISNLIKKRKDAKRQKLYLENITLEDPNFSRKYEVSSADEIESRYLVTTSFMDRFNNLHTAFGSKRAKCSFYEDKIMFAIPTRKNLFEIGSLFHPVNNINQINILLKEISAIYKLIDYFKLDEKTGL